MTRDLRRQEFKDILQRKDKLNELLSNTNSILTQILEELKMRNQLWNIDIIIKLLNLQYLLESSFVKGNVLCIIISIF